MRIYAMINSITINNNTVSTHILHTRYNFR